MFNRVFLIVLDSFGIGSFTDEDKGANTALHVIDNNPDISFNGFKQLGLNNLLGKSTDKTIGYYTIGSFISSGKDSLTGHYELMGIETKTPYNTFYGGFPADLITRIETELNRKVIGNKVADGIAIIKELGEQQQATGSLIIYTSADSVLQVAAHTKTIPLEELYTICKRIKEITDENDAWKVGRVVARPFIGDKGLYQRTTDRKDFVSKLPYKSVLNILKDNSYQTIGIGKIGDIFGMSGITKSYKTANNIDGLNKITEMMAVDFSGLCFTNLNDLDSSYGHRRNVYGYAKCLKEIDTYLPLIINNSRPTDLIIITGDHGNDPTYEGTDHTKENVPIFLYSKRFVDPKQLENLKTISDIGATIAEIFDVNPGEIGESFLNKLS